MPGRTNFCGAPAAARARRSADLGGAPDRGGDRCDPIETDRREFLGRGNSAALPDALKRDLTGSTGVVLDPVFSLRCRLALDPRARQVLTFVTVAAPTRDALMALVNKYGHPESVARAFELAWTHGQLEFRYLGIGVSAARRFQDWPVTCYIRTNGCVHRKTA